MRCGLGGLPPVVVTPFGRLGVGSDHQVDRNMRLCTFS